MPPPPVLLLTHSGDFYTIDRVEEGLDRRGIHHLRVDTDAFPTQLRLSVRTRARSLERVLDFGTFSLDLDTIPAIWARRLWPGRMPSDLDPHVAQHAATAARTTFFDTLLGLAAPRWVNPLAPAMRAESKLLQLERALELGLRVPDTLITHDPSRVSSFAAEHDGRVVTKLLEPLSQTMDASGEFFYTTALGDVGELSALRWSPQIFQPHLPKHRELRVIVIGEHLFVGALDLSGADVVDWRRLRASDGLRWQPHALPPDVEAKARALVARLGLVYGALDFIETGEGEAYFLEINPAGEWGWLERDLGFPIGDRIAEALAQGMERA